ncbi:MAG: YihY/virulence factor BrkB family protein [Verrucomicrobiota bacterium]
MASPNLLKRHLSNIFPVLSIYAGGIAFFFLLSMVPFLVVTLGLFHVLSPLDLSEQVVAIVKDLIPQQELLNVRAIVGTAEQAGSKGLLTVTFIFALWTTSSFMGSLTQALHLIFATTEVKHPKSGWRVRLYAFIMVLIWALFITLTALLFLVAPVLEAWLVLIPEVPAIHAYFIKGVRLTFLFLMFVIAFGASYRLNAKRVVRTRACIEGGALATLGWMAIGWAFTHWLPALWKHSVAFGAMGSVFATLMWAFAAAWIVLAGGIWILVRERQQLDF